MDLSNYLAVAALDFGSTYSGYAYSFKSDYERDKLRININQVWVTNCALGSYKNSTCILLDKNRELEAFGYDAEERYSDLCADGEHSDFFFFKGFYTRQVLG